MSMYAKLMSRITESSLMEEPLPARYCFMMLLAIADPKGYVVGTDVAIARRMNMPLADFKACMADLMKPDEHSNSKEHEGRRVVLSDCERGYYVVNYTKYRDTRDEEQRREYMRAYMQKVRAEKAVNTVNTSKNPVNSRKQRKPRLANAEGEVEGEKIPSPAATGGDPVIEDEKPETPKPKAVASHPDHSAFVLRWMELYPVHHGGEEYKFQGGKDGAALKILLQASKKTVPELERIFREAWKHPGGFHCKFAATICGFNSHFNDIRNELNANREKEKNEAHKNGANGRNAGHNANVASDYAARPKRTQGTPSGESKAS